jgi:VanZ family protein
MNDQQGRRAHVAIIEILCVCTLVTILVAGLWPFHAPKNNVEWLGKEDGLQFGRYGSIVSTDAFRPGESNRDDLGSLEIWIAAAPAKSRHTIVAFEGAGQSEVPFRLQQNGQTLIVQRHNVDDRGTDRTAEFGVERALPEGQIVLLTVTLGKHETSVYLNGVLARTAPILGSSTGNFVGRLVLGSSPSASDSWVGLVLGLAIFRSQLTSSRVVEDYRSWTKNGRPVLLLVDEPAALYLFNEHGGRLVRNQINSTTDLKIPAHYFVLHPEFLSLPWRHYHATWSYWADVAINVLGFIPFGFSIVGYFSSVRPFKSSTTITIALGFITSLVIEVWQAFLPTRDSGTNDLITNTLGTVIGVVLYRSLWLQTFVLRSAFLINPLCSKTVDNIEVGSQV